MAKPLRVQIAELQVALREAESEIVRHHADFTRISNICEVWRMKLMTGDQAVRQIQGVVG
jgi:hypothetical protein